MRSEPNSATFETTVAASGNNTGIVVPGEVINQLGAGNRPPVIVNVNDHEYRNTVAVMGGKYMISVSAAVRKATGLKAGDPIRVTLTVADTPRDVAVPADLAAALEADDRAGAFFVKLSNSMQRYHIDNINAAKSDETRLRRITKAVSLFARANHDERTRRPARLATATPVGLTASSNEMVMTNARRSVPISSAAHRNRGSSIDRPASAARSAGSRSNRRTCRRSTATGGVQPIVNHMADKLHFNAFYVH
jgi:hypothetical protein